MWIRTILLSLVNVLLFFELIFILGWLDIGDQSNYQILRSIIIGPHFFVTILVFIISLFVLTEVKNFRSAVLRMVVALTISVAGYTLIARYLVEKLNG